MIQITPAIAIDEREIHEVFIRASGPGGQHVNKVASAVQILFHVTGSLSLTKDVQQRLIKISGGRITEDGILIPKSCINYFQKRSYAFNISEL